MTLHWTLLALYALCFACIAGNALRWWIVGNVRWLGLALCAAWAAQQLYWWHRGTDSLAMFAVCDAIIIVLSLTERHWTAKAVRWLIVTGWAFTALQWAHGPYPAAWWGSWATVAGAMVLAMPWPGFQRATGSYSHGARKGAHCHEVR